MIEKPGQRLRLNLRQLEVFVATASTGSSRAAAQHISRSQSAASSALGELEAVLGAQLFDRTGRRLVLNENGRALLPRASALLDQAGDLQGLLSGEYLTELKVAASLTIGEYLLPDLLAQWRRAHAHAKVHMLIGNSSQVIDNVVGLAADIGFIEGPQIHSDLRVLPWKNDELVIVASPAYPRAGRVLTSRQLSDAAWILREPGSGTRQASDRWLLQHLDTLHIEFELHSTEAIKRLAAAGAGIACLSRHAVASDLARGSLVELRTRLPVARRRLDIVVRRDRRLGRATQEFLRHCSQIDTGP
ncbi:MAG: LysR family transcriptional regulator [Burkholderiaceae bacterium]